MGETACVKHTDAEVASRRVLYCRQYGNYVLRSAENDFDTTAGNALAAELKRLHKPYALRIYPPVGLTSDDGHNNLYENIPAWESDVFEFLDQYVKR